MYPKRPGPGAEQPAVRVDDIRSVDVSDLAPDFDERLFASGAAAQLAKQRISAPIARLCPILGIGLNCRDHAAHHLSQFMVAEPGDRISTGTPPGVVVSPR
jgi:2,4-didehydro-3-deoxy-L-rhamnonate hydrolase